MKSLVPTPNVKKIDICIHFKWEKAKIGNTDGKKNDESEVSVKVV